jgi:hypothetical protein
LAQVGLVARKIRRCRMAAASNDKELCSSTVDILNTTTFRVKKIIFKEALNLAKNDIWIEPCLAFLVVLV